ncbi:Dabb domain-containing protein [Cephalotus follicularis]|uniref:Dabb domain-containing protein n=1 Tax=Cephalotus follicularis TaxID=3775 RepID=A0A1Q3C0X2_CEPFO|nr:Dabb domain-containing protein [Cephalotus follicularis]
MWNQALTLSLHFPIHHAHTHSHYHRQNPRLYSSPSSNASRFKRVMSMDSWRRRNRRTVFTASTGETSSIGIEKTRKVVEHICLLKAKKELLEEEENEMLDYLFTSQYHMRGILAISLGRISDENVENFTHAVYMRFQSKKNLSKFYENPFYLGVLKEHVMPYCHGLINVDYESEVEDDILPIFRKGEEFNYGVEFVLLIAFVESAFGGPVEDALASFKELTEGFLSLIVQSTQGANFNVSSEEYTHGLVIRFRSLEAFEIFMSSSEYKDIWRSKFQQIIRKTLHIHFSVDPVGNEIM